ncbi:xanthine dehydrogenase family protein molybdopterin-binding subunit [Vulcanisaeta thermophila]|uniref:xanthine dehydrogenase family protein molybdopterin-binding subunit n=1 Tax=Vulcanisaeta thermophila TaxID=867917 RepID=UPI000853DA0D|nr:xanthine dehydrogenase family protein molybdopterin-binding subunit [Vulcanisaeta thermophila]
MPLKEDLDVILARSNYLDDIKLSGMVYLHIIRSPHARARIVRINPPGERALLFLTHQDIGNLLMPSQQPSVNANIVRMPVLAKDVVNYVGQPVAAVVTEERYETEDVAEEISVDYEPLPAVVTIDDALEGRVIIHGELRTNVSVDVTLEGGELSLFREADVVVEREIEQSRLVANPMEPKGVVAHYTGDRLIIYASTQSPFRVKSDIVDVLKLPPETVVVYAPKNVGGGFGNKTPAYPEYVLAALASMKLRRPVKYVETRTEHLMNPMQGRGVKSKMRLYAKRDGTVLGIEGKIIVNIGAYNFSINAGMPIFIANLSTGPYRMRAVRVRAMGVFTNTPPLGPYRGAGRPEAALIHETLMDTLADELGLDPLEVRRRNVIRDNETFKMPLGLVVDSGNYQTILEEAGRIYQDLRGKYRDKGVSIVLFALFVSTLGGEGIKFRVGNGRLRLIIGSRTQGQAHISAFTKYLSETFGVPEELIEVIPGNTEDLSYGIGTFGSRSTTVVTAAITEASEKLLDEIKSRGLTLMDAIKSPNVIELEYHYMPKFAIFAPGAHVAVVDFDPEVMEARVVEYYAVYNVGKTLIKEEVDGQLMGGVLQGAAQVLWEGAVYDEDGNPLHLSLADYGMPNPADVNYRVITIERNTQSILPGGVRGVGEAGTTGALPAVFIALERAVRARLGVSIRINKTPVRPDYLFSLVGGFVRGRE